VLDIAAPTPFDLEAACRASSSVLSRASGSASPRSAGAGGQTGGRDQESGLFVRGELQLPDAPLLFPALATA
jgi:hypothetical protein